MLPSEYPEVQPYYHLKRLLQNQVDPQIVDLRTMLRLPQARLESSCNFTAAGALLNLIAGASVCFYDASEAALRNRHDRSRRFRETLRHFYPWSGEPLPTDDCVAVLYDAARNPLVHSLGLDSPPTARTGRQVVFLKQRPLSEAEVRELEHCPNRPSWASTTIIHQRGLAYGSTEVAISVPTLYWGTHRMLQALFTDTGQVANADALARLFAPQWDKAIFETISVQEAVNVDRQCATCSTTLVPAGDGQMFRCPRCDP